MPLTETSGQAEFPPLIAFSTFKDAVSVWGKLKSSLRAAKEDQEPTRSPFKP